MHRITGPNDRLEMTTNSSRILTLDQKIPQVQVNNPEILELTPLSPNQVQVAAKKPGVTQINLWGENKQIYTVDVTVVGDARELAMILRTQFPRTVLSVIPVGSGLMISGYVDHPEQVPLIVEIAKEYYPKIINNMTVSGVQQALLHVKVMEVSRTKMRQLGFDFANLNGGNMFLSQVSGLITSISSGSVALANNPTVQFRIGNSNAAFFGVLDALAAGQPGENPGGAEPGGHQRPAGLLPGGRRVRLPAQRRHHRPDGPVQRLRHADRLRAHRHGQRPDPLGGPRQRQ